jgi:uncharacterized protein (DUF2384 family)
MSTSLTYDKTFLNAAEAVFPADAIGAVSGLTDEELERIRGDQCVAAARITQLVRVVRTHEKVAAVLGAEDAKQWWNKPLTAFEDFTGLEVIQLGMYKELMEEIGRLEVDATQPKAADSSSNPPPGETN